MFLLVDAEIDKNGVVIEDKEERYELKIRFLRSMNDGKMQKLLVGRGGAFCILCSFSHDDVVRCIFPLIFNYSKAGRSPAGLSLRSRLAKPGPASWLGTQVTWLWSAALDGAPTAGEFGCRDTGSWGTPALAPHLLPISQPENVTLALRFGCIQELLG